jgi:hypothetical protein
MAALDYIYIFIMYYKQIFFYSNTNQYLFSTCYYTYASKLSSPPRLQQITATAAAAAAAAAVVKLLVVYDLPRNKGTTQNGR